MCESDSGHTVCGTLSRLNICYELYLELDVSMKLCVCWNHLALKVTVWGYLDWGRRTMRSAVIALPMIRVSNRRVVKSSIMKRGYLYERVFTSESLIPRPCF